MDKIRMLDRSVLAIALCVGLAAGSAVFAADAGTDKVAAAMDAMDGNHDGMVSAKEHAAYASSRFDAMDADHNGQVTTTEMDAARKDMMKGKSTAMQAMSSASRVKAMDLNNDGMVSAEEHATAAKKMFDSMDDNHDGQLSMDEMRIGHDRQAAVGDDSSM